MIDDSMIRSDKFETVCRVSWFRSVIEIVMSGWMNGYMDEWVDGWMGIRPK